jgi:hypothetical protein
MADAGNAFLVTRAPKGMNNAPGSSLMSDSSEAPGKTESLFSYGTLQLVPVQLSTFGRTLEGAVAQLPGFRKSLVRIEDPKVVETSGMTHHPIVQFTGDDGDRVDGTVFLITGQELLNADKYEVAAYKRIAVTLVSGLRAWVYIDARHASP